MITRILAAMAASLVAQRRRLAWGTAAFLLSVSTALAVPQGGEIVAGDGRISMLDSRTMQIFQDSHSLAIDWTSFNVALNERVVFQQPSSTASALNRIFDQNPSQIFGVIDANGRVFLINPNGMVFGRSAQINLQSLVASSLDISVEDFMNGNYTLEALADQKGGLIINRGTIHAADGGSIALVGTAVTNEGLLIANHGSVNLAAGRVATLDFTGEGLMLFSIDEGAIESESSLTAAVHNSGQIVANGGQVLLTASSASDVLSSVVNNSGVIRAGRIDDSGGVIRLVADGGSAVNSGHLLARGETPDDTGGSISVLGDSVSLNSGAVLDASGPAGGGDVRIGGELYGGGDLQAAQFTDIEAGVTIAANAEVEGDGGNVLVWSDDTTRFEGDISVQGGQLSGDGGFVEISGKQHLAFNGQVDGRAANGRFGSLLLDPGTVTVCAENGTTCVQGAMDRLTDDQLEGLLATMSTTISTAVDGVAGPLDILFEDSTISITWATASVLELIAGRNVLLDGTINATGTGALSVLFGQSEAGLFTLASTASLMAAGIDVTGGDFNNTFTIGAAFSGNLTGGNLDDSFVFADGATVGGSVDGGAGMDTLDWSAYLSARMVMLTAAGATDGVGGTESSIAGGFDNIDALTGSGLAGDSLTGANVATTWNVSGTDDGTIDLGSDTIVDVSFTDYANLLGGTNTDDFTLMGGTVTGTINGGTGADNLVADNIVNTWMITSSDAGTLNGNAFTAVENLTGGTNTDDFTLMGGTVSGFINGGGGAGINSLTGDGVANTWALNAIDGGTVTGVTGVFSDIDNVTGGSQTDGFTITAAWGGNIAGGAEIDTFNLNAGGNVVGTLAGDGGNDVFNFDSGAAVSPASISGGAGDDDFNFLSGSVNTVVDGDAGADDFNFSAGAAATMALNGGIGNDNYTLADLAIVAGIIDGEAGTDTLSWLAYTTARTLDLTGAGVTDGFDGSETVGSVTAFQNIDGFVSSGTGDTLNAPDTANIWIVTGTDIFTLNATLFTDYANLVGGTNTDDFTLMGGTVSGSINGGGGAGINSLTGDGVANTWALNAIDGGTVTGVTGVFSDIDNVTGGSQTDGFTITAAWGGNIAGGAEIDTFNLNAGGNVVGTLAGDGGNDVFNFDSGAAVSPASISGGAGDDDFNFLSGSVNTVVDGDAGADDFNFAAGAAATMALNGGADNDNYTLADLAIVAGIIDGEAGTDTLSWLAYTTARTLDLTGAGVTDGFDGSETVGSVTAFQNIDGFVSSGTGDTLNAPDTANIWIVTGTDIFTLNATLFTDYANLVGGTNTDDFTLMGGTVSGSINGGGGAGINSLTGDGVANTWALNAIDGGTVTGVTGVFSDIDNVTGGSLTDGFTITAAWGGNIAGGAEIDTFNLNAGGNVVGTLAGDGGNDVFNFDSGAAVSPASISGGAGDDDFNFLSGSVNTVVDGDAGADDFNFSAGAAATMALNGGIGNDNYTLADLAIVAGIIDGEAGTDTLSWLAYTTARTLDLTGAGVTDGFDGSETVGSVTAFQNIDGFVSSGTGDTLNAPDTANIWIVTGTDIFTLNATLFTDYANLVGGTNTDDFTLMGGTVSGFINGGGGAGINSLTGDGVANTWALNAIDGGTVTGVTGVFSDIDNVTGGSLTDGFTITAAWGGNIAGGAEIDTFNLNAGGNVLGTLAGDGGNDVFNFDSGAAVSPASISGGAGDDDFNFLSGSVNTVVDGDAGADDFNFSAGAAATMALNGGIGNDNYTLADLAMVAGIIDGEAGTDTLDWSAYTTARAVILTGLGGTDGVAGSEVSITGGFDNIDALIGSGITGVPGDSLMGPDMATTWNVLTADTGNVDLGSDLTVDVTFTGIANLYGGSMADNFVFADAATISGSIDGGAGTDTLDWSAYTTARAVILTGLGGTDGVAGSEVSITGGFDNIDALIGSGITGVPGDSLMGPDMATTWNVLTADTGNVDLGSDLTVDVTFTDIANLYGGSMADNFVFADAATISGSIDGGAGTDTLDWSAYTTARAVILTGLGGTDGVAGSEVSITGGFDNIDALIGSGITGVPGDSLMGPDMATTWNVLTADTGNVDLGSDLTVDVTFTDIANLYGGSMADNFVFADAATISGSIDGGAGTDTLDWSAYTTARAVILTGLGGTDGVAGSEVSITGGFDNIDALIGSGITGVPGDSLMGPDMATTWNVLTADTGNVDLGSDLTVDVTFTDIANLYGGSMADNFVFADAATISGSIDGGAGTDTLDWSAYTTARAVILTGLGGTDGVAGSEVSITGGFDNIDALIGSGITGVPGDSLMGPDMATTWNVLTADTGNVDLGSDLTVDVTFTDIANLYGGSMADNFVFADAATISGSIDGGAGTDTLDWSAYTTARAVILTAAGVTDGLVGSEVSITGGFDNIDALIGSGITGVAGDTLTGRNVAATFMLTADGGTYTSTDAAMMVRSLVFSAFEVLQGGSDIDTFNLDGLPAGTVNLTLAGGAGDDVIEIGADDVGVMGELTFDGGEGIDDLQTTGGRVMASLLTIGDVEIIGGLAMQAFLTSVTRLDLSGIGSAFIDEEDDLDLAALVASGNVELNAGGAITDSGVVNVTGETDLTAGGDITLDNVLNSFGGLLSLSTVGNATVFAANAVVLGASDIGSNLDVTTTDALTVDGAIISGGNIDFTASDAITQNAAITASTGNVSLDAGGAITQAANTGIAALGLDATAIGGIALAGTNTVSSFSAENTISGDITLVNDAANLELLNISQSGGGGISINNAGAMTLNGVLSNGAGSIELIADGAIDQTDGAITAASLETTSTGGLTLNQDNQIAFFSGTNTDGDVILNNTVALQLGDFAQSGGGLVSITNSEMIDQTGSLTTNGGDINIETTTGDLLLTLLDAGAGMVTAQADGNIVNSAGVGSRQAVIVSDNISLIATGMVGMLSNPLFVTAFSAQGDVLSVAQGQQGSVDTLKNFTSRESESLTAGLAINAFSESTTAASIASSGTSTGLIQLVLDAAAFQEGIEIYSIVNPAVLMPCDQLEEDEARCQKPTAR